MEEPKNNSLKIIFFTLGLVLLFSIGTFGYYKYTKIQEEKTISEATNARVELNKKIGDSLLRRNSTGLKEYFINDIKNNKNNALSKAAIYFITHRFFDNGGDIYEIVDYVGNNPELTFLQSAKNIYPEIFAKIDKREEIPKTERLLAYLAYLEALNNGGYADTASFGTAAARYMELYYFEKLAGKQEETIVFYREKAIMFAKLSRPVVEKVMENGNYIEEAEYSKDDILVGLNQYALTLAFFKKYNVDYDTQYSYEQVFDFAVYYSSTNKLILDPFTRLNYAYALVFTNTIDGEKIKKTDLGSAFINTFKTTKYSENSLMDKIVNGEKKGYNKDGLFGQNTILKISQHDKEFKDFLISRNYVFTSKTINK